MAHNISIQPTGVVDSIAQDGARLSAIVGRWLRRRAVYNQVMRELEDYTPRQLEDIGISPADIRHFARQAAEAVR